MEEVVDIDVNRPIVPYLRELYRVFIGYCVFRDMSFIEGYFTHGVNMTVLAEDATLRTLGRPRRCVIRLMFDRKYITEEELVAKDVLLREGYDLSKWYNLVQIL
jgi:hypothetical protein